MKPIARRVVLAGISLAICIGLLALAPHVAQPPVPANATLLEVAESPAALIPSALAVVAPDRLPPLERPSISTNMALSALAADAPATFADLDALEQMPSPLPAPTTRPKPRPAPIVIEGRGPAMRGTLVAQTERIDVYVGTNTFNADDLASVAWKLESLLIQNESGFYPTKLGRRISIGFYSKASAPSKGTRGIAYTDAGRIEVFYNPNEDMTAAFTVASHELAHQLQYQRYGSSVHPRSDFILLEGMATWVAGVRWLKEYGVPSWRGRAFQLYQRGVPLQIVGAQRYGADNAYELWASFVSYIYKNYGMETVDELYRSSRGRAVGTADYKAVTGRTLQQLTEDWRAWVLAYEPPSPTPEPTVALPTATPRPKPGK